MCFLYRNKQGNVYRVFKDELKGKTCEDRKYLFVIDVGNEGCNAMELQWGCSLHARSAMEIQAEIYRIQSLIKNELVNNNVLQSFREESEGLKKNRRMSASTISEMKEEENKISISFFKI